MRNFIKKHFKGDVGAMGYMGPAGEPGPRGPKGDPGYGFSYDEVVKFKKIHKDAIIPEYAHPSDAAVDFYALEDCNNKKKKVKINTGLIWCPPNDGNKYVLILKDKSSKCFFYNVVGGVIDSGYRSEIIICLKKKKKVKIKKREKVAQGIIFQIPVLSIEESNNIDTNTDRGTGGFGSSGR